MGGNTTTSDSKLGTNSGFDLIIETANSERLRITDAGKIGIGTDNPEVKLHVVGDFTLNGGLRLSSWYDESAELRRYMYLTPSGDVGLRSGQEFAAEAYRFDCKLDMGDLYPSPAWRSEEGELFGKMFTGWSCPTRVGIGTNMPASALDVRGQTTLQRLLIGPAQELDIYYQLQSGYLDINNEYRTTLMLHRSNGLQLNFEDTEGAWPLRIQAFTGTEPVFRIHRTGSIDLNYFGAGNELLFNAYNRTTDAQIATLTTDGIWYCQGVVVKHVPFWPDYVFSTEHQLWSLYELESYLLKNRHLPGVPSEEEVLENGLELVTIITTLTEKIEELTLYAIQQQKEIDALKSKKQKNRRTAK